MRSLIKVISQKATFIDDHFTVKIWVEMKRFTKKSPLYNKRFFRDYPVQRQYTFTMIGYAHSPQHFLAVHWCIAQANGGQPSARFGQDIYEIFSSFLIYNQVYATDCSTGEPAQAFADKNLVGQRYI